VWLMPENRVLPPVVHVLVLFVRLVCDVTTIEAGKVAATTPDAGFAKLGR
jgi:hypothetical protein